MAYKSKITFLLKFKRNKAVALTVTTDFSLNYGNGVESRRRAVRPKIFPSWWVVTSLWYSFNNFLGASENGLSPSPYREIQTRNNEPLKYKVSKRIHDTTPAKVQPARRLNILLIYFKTSQLMKSECLPAGFACHLLGAVLLLLEMIPHFWFPARHITICIYSVHDRECRHCLCPSL